MVLSLLQEDPLNWLSVIKLYMNVHVSTFEVDKSQVFSAVVLHNLHTVHYDGSTEDVSQGKDVDLLQRLAFLVGQCQHCRPVLLQLVLVETVPLQVSLALFLLLPTLVEPGNSQSHQPAYMYVHIQGSQ